MGAEELSLAAKIVKVSYGSVGPKGLSLIPSLSPGLAATQGSQQPQAGSPISPSFTLGVSCYLSVIFKCSFPNDLFEVWVSN